MATSVSSVSALSICAACGEEEDGDTKLKFCTACKLVKYCNRDCQIAHRKQHKKECKERVAELRDEKLFKDVEPEDCPICFLPHPHDNQSAFYTCCGKHICDGCVYAMKKSEGKDLCAFCRMPPPKGEEEIERTKKLIDKGNAYAHNFLAYQYHRGEMGLPQDQQQAFKFYFKAGELGCTEAYYNLGASYQNGNGVELDMEKAKHYYELAAMGGDVDARFNLGRIEGQAGNMDRAMKYFISAARAGHEKSLEGVKHGFKVGLVTKDEYETTLRAYHERQKEMKSDARDEVATAAAQL